MDDRAQFIRGRPTEKYNMNCVVGTVKRPASMMIWSVISAKCQGNGKALRRRGNYAVGPISEGSGDKVAPPAARMIWQWRQSVHAR